MARSRIDASVRTELVDALDTLLDECSALNASRSELGDAILITPGTAATGACGPYSVLGVSACSAKAEN